MSKTRWINVDELMERVEACENLLISRKIDDPVDLKYAEVIIKLNDLREIVEVLAAESNPETVLLLSFGNSDNPEQKEYMCPICNKLISFNGEKSDWEDVENGST